MSGVSTFSAFSLSRLALVARKEFTDLLRDRKSIFWALFAVAISGPLVVGALADSIRANKNTLAMPRIYVL